MLTDHHERFVNEQVAAGRFRDASEVFNAGLELLEASVKERGKEFEELSRAIEVGAKDLDEGRSILLEGSDALRDHLDAKLAQLS